MSIECNIIDWRITAKCNSKCDYCYASMQLPELVPADVDKVINSIILSGCKAVCISGGEPLLSANVINIIKRLHSNGLSIFLSTNGTLYMQYREELEKYISKLSLPLDGYDEESNKINGRELSTGEGEKSSFQCVKEILDYYETHPHNFAIKIGTVLTAKNLSIGYFSKMFDFLKSYSIDLWKVYEFIPEERGETNYAELTFSQEQLTSFEHDFKNLQNAFSSSCGFDCLLSTRKIRDSAYLIIRPDGTAIVPVDKGKLGVEEVLVGDLKVSSITEVLSRWSAVVDSIKHNANYETRCVTRTLAKMHIDEIDKELLYYLDLKPLQSYEELSKKISGKNLSVEEVQTRIEKLYSIRAIRHIMPIINVSQFGLEVFLVNLYFKPNSNLDSTQIADILCHDPYIAWVAECYEYSTTENYVIFRISFLIENNSKLYEKIKYLRSIFGEILYRYETDSVPDKYICGQSFLIDQKNNSLLSHDHIVLDSNKARISKKEYAVITAMNSYERLTIDSIAKSTSLSKKTVNKIIDELLARSVINKFQVVLDTNVLGYQCYMYFVKFNSCRSKEAFEEYAKMLPSVTHINTLNAGKWDIDVEVHVSKPSECAKIWADLECRFGENILEKKLIRIKKDHKFKFLIHSTLSAIEDSVDQQWRRK